MRNFEEYIPNVRDNKRGFSFPSITKTPIGYVFLFGSLAVFLTLSLLHVSNKFKELYAFYHMTATQLEQVNSESVKLEQKTLETMRTLGYSEKNINEIEAQFKGLGELPSPFTPSDVDALTTEQWERWNAMQKKINDPFSNLLEKNIKQTDELNVHDNSIKGFWFNDNKSSIRESKATIDSFASLLASALITRPFPKRSERLEASKDLALAKLRDAKLLNIQYAKIEKRFSDQLIKQQEQAAAKQAREQEQAAAKQAREQEQAAAKQAREQAPASNATNRPVDQPRSLAPANNSTSRQSRPSAPSNNPPATPSKQSDIPVW